MKRRKKKPELNSNKLDNGSFFPKTQKNRTIVNADSAVSTQLAINRKATKNTINKGETIKTKRSTFFAPRFGNGFQTVCDVNIHPDDRIKYQLKKDIRHVGTGLPEVKTLAVGKGLKESNPCIYEAAMAHEQVHIDNAKANCKGFKKCLDDEVDNNIFFDTISRKEYDDCYKKHHGGLAAACKTDEQQAYTKTVQIAEELLKKSKCKPEKTNLKNNIKQWKIYAITPPNC